MTAYDLIVMFVIMILAVAFGWGVFNTPEFKYKIGFLFACIICLLIVCLFIYFKIFKKDEDEEAKTQ
jgi:hypothetical protein